MPDRLIQLGVIGRAHGVRGHARVTSHTADPAGLTEYGPLTDGAGRRFALRWIGENVAEITEIADGKRVKVADRAAAERLTNTKLFIERDRLPAPEADEYYLADLIGLAAVDADGARLGVVSTVHDYGGGASLEIEREGGGAIIVPFTAACVPNVDIASGRVVVALPDEVDAAGTGAGDDVERDEAGPHTVLVGPQSGDHVGTAGAMTGRRSGPLSRHDTETDHRVEPDNDVDGAREPERSAAGMDTARRSAA